MRRLLFFIAAAFATCMLAACGNKGPLYRPSVAPAASGTAAAPAPAASVPSDGHAG
jgi:predicted small lipoprotein YifL